MIRSISGIAPVMFYGRGIFQYSFGLMPFRVPVNLVGENLFLKCVNFGWDYQHERGCGTSVPFSQSEVL